MPDSLKLYITKILPFFFLHMIKNLALKSFKLPLALSTHRFQCKTIKTENWRNVLIYQFCLHSWIQVQSNNNNCQKYANFSLSPHRGPFWVELWPLLMIKSSSVWSNEETYSIFLIKGWESHYQSVYIENGWRTTQENFWEMGWGAACGLRDGAGCSIQVKRRGGVHLAG